MHLSCCSSSVWTCAHLLPAEREVTNYERNDSKSRRKKVAPAMPAVRCPNRAAASNVCRSSFWCQPASPRKPPIFLFSAIQPDGAQQRLAGCLLRRERVRQAGSRSRSAPRCRIYDACGLRACRPRLHIMNVRSLVSIRARGCRCTPSRNTSSAPSRCRRETQTTHPAAACSTRTPFSLLPNRQAFPARRPLRV